MAAIRYRLRMLAGGTWAWIRDLDAALVILVTSFVLAVPVGSLPLAARLMGMTAAGFRNFERALPNAALKRPGYDGFKFSVPDVSKPFALATTRQFAIGTVTLDRNIWVSLPDALKQACQGEADADRALEEILGLQPHSGQRLIYEVTLHSDPASRVIRPCLSGTDIRSGCSLSMQQLPADVPAAWPAAASDDDKAKEYLALHQAYDDLHFLAGQMWTAYRTGFDNKDAQPGSYPYTGFPFTGMGWTYDYRQSAPNHFGVDEFVITQGSTVEIGGGTGPAAFCRAAK